MAPKSTLRLPDPAGLINQIRRRGPAVTPTYRLLLFHYAAGDCQIPDQMHYGISGEGRAVNGNRVLGSNQWRGRSVTIPRVPLFYVSQKARETNTLTHALQLKQTSLLWPLRWPSGKF